MQRVSCSPGGRRLLVWALESEPWLLESGEFRAPRLGFSPPGVPALQRPFLSPNTTGRVPALCSTCPWKIACLPPSPPSLPPFHRPQSFLWNSSYSAQSFRRRWPHSRLLTRSSLLGWWWLWTEGEQLGLLTLAFVPKGFRALLCLWTPKIC